MDNNNTTTMPVPTHGAMIQFTPEVLADLLGLEGCIGQIVQDQSTGIISVIALGDKEYFPAITEKGEVHIARPVWLKEVKSDRALKLILEDSTTFVHREGKKNV